MSVLWHYLQNGTTQGPVPEEQLRGLITSGTLRPADQVWHEGLGGWTAIQAIPELNALFPQTSPAPTQIPPVQPPATGGQPQAPPKKSGGVLPWILGGCGVLLAVVLIGGVVTVLWVRKKVSHLQSNPAVAAAELIVRANPELEVVATDYAKGTITMRNRKTGETLTMDANQAKEGRFSFKDGKGAELRVDASEGGAGTLQVQGPEGQVSFGAGTKVQTPSWLPTYPGSPTEGVMSATGKDGLTGTVVQKTAASPTKVLETLERAFKDGGLTVGTVRTPDGGMVIGDQKDLKRHVVATIGADQGRTVVTITYKEGN